MSKEFKHTPWPWYPVNYAGYWEIQTEPYYGETSVLNEDKCKEAEANAILSAAAPELLEMLTHAVQWIEGTHGETHDTIIYKRVINKAKGL